MSLNKNKAGTTYMLVPMTTEMAWAVGDNSSKWKDNSREGGNPADPRETLGIV